MTFSEKKKKKLREFIASRLALQEKFKVPQGEEK